MEREGRTRHTKLNGNAASHHTSWPGRDEAAVESKPGALDQRPKAFDGHH
jgi:hypothetical protein